jgi:DNA-binding GntR family transcriptional regulator
MASTHPDRRKLYVRIADELREELAAGKYPIGEPFPSIGELAERFGAAKMTVDRAVEVLRGEGYLESRQGSRTMVIALPEIRPDHAGEPQEHSEEFEILFGQLQEIRQRMKSFAAKLEELDQRTKHL